MAGFYQPACLFDINNMAGIIGCSCSIVIGNYGSVGRLCALVKDVKNNNKFYKLLNSDNLYNFDILEAIFLMNASCVVFSKRL